jgi:hypothetical protein
MIHPPFGGFFFIGSLPYCVGYDHEIFGMASLRSDYSRHSLEERIGKASMVISAMPNICFSSPYHMFTHTIGKRTFLFYAAPVYMPEHLPYNNKRLPRAGWRRLPPIDTHQKPPFADRQPAFSDQEALYGSPWPIGKTLCQDF